MIQTLRQIKSRIRGIENTRKITRAMEMVSAAKLNRVKKAFYAFRPYFSNLESIMKDLIADMPLSRHPLIRAREHIARTGVCVITSDTGLCGAYNHNIIRHAGAFLDGRERGAIRMITVGKESFSYFTKHEYPVEKSYLGLYGRYSEALSDRIASDMIEMYSSGEVDEIYIAYTHFSASLRHATTIDKFLPIESGHSKRKYFILEPDADRVMGALVPAYLLNRMRVIILDAFTAEHSARMLAMKTATDNADDLIYALTMARNKARQAAITKEILEIAMSAEALKG